MKKVLILNGSFCEVPIIKKAKELAKEGDVVTLSPACASFDMFKNFAVRGNVFKKIVKEP